MEALTGLINTYVQKTDHWNSNDNTSNTRTNHNHSNQTEERAPPTEKAFQGRAHLKTDIKETDNIQKKTDIDRNLYKLANTKHTISHNTNHDNIECQNIDRDNNNITINHTTNTKDDESLVILAKQTTLTDSQKNVLRKGLKFIELPTQTLHTDITNFMQRLKTILYELRTTNRPKKKYYTETICTKT